MSNIIYDYLSTPIETFLEKVQVNFLEFQRQDHSYQINAISDLLTKDKYYAPFFKKINLNSEDVVGGRQPISNNFLKSVSIENFKTIKNQTIELNNLNVFIGRNNVGKSNILSFFEFIFKVPLSVNIFKQIADSFNDNPNNQFNLYQDIKGGQGVFLSYGRECSDDIKSVLKLDNSIEFYIDFVATDNQERLKSLQKIVHLPLKVQLSQDLLLLIYMCYIVVERSYSGNLPEGIYQALSRPYQATEITIKNWQNAIKEFSSISLDIANSNPTIAFNISIANWEKLIKSYEIISNNTVVGHTINTWKLLNCCFGEYEEIQNLTEQEFVEGYKFAVLVYKNFFSDLVFGTGMHLSLLPDTVYPKFDLPIFHLNNTDNKSPIRNYPCDIRSDSFFLRDNCENLATILLLIKTRYQTHYQFLINHIKEVVLDFNDFELRPNPNLQDEVSLLWTSIHNPNKPLTTRFLSDGSIRFIALATILLMPPALQPAIIVIDEPELGLHPWAIKSLGGILKYAAKYRQIIISTQSPYLLEEVGINHIIAVDRIDKYSSFKRLSEEELKNWLLDFSITELWDMNIIGANN